MVAATAALPPAACVLLMCPVPVVPSPATSPLRFVVITHGFISFYGYIPTLEPQRVSPDEGFSHFAPGLPDDTAKGSA